MSDSEAITVKTASARAAAILLATTVLVSIPAAAAQSSDEQPVTRLRGVTVTEKAAPPFAIEKARDEGYKADRTITATKTDTPLIDVPQSVAVVTAQQIEDQAAFSIADAIRYVPGVSIAQGEGNREALVLRGNSTTGDFFVDGIRDDIQTYRDLYNIERLEVFKGPNAMIFGRGGVGGVVNRVTKQAGWDTVREFRLEGGSYEHVRGSFDFGGAVADAVALRLTGVYQDSGSYRDGVDYNRWGFNPTASFQLGENTLVQVGYEHFKDERVADRGVPAQFRPAGTVGAVEPLRTPRGQFFGDPENSPTYTNTDAANFAVEHRFSDSVSLRNHTRYADYDKLYRNVFPGAVNAAQTTVSLSAYDQGTQRENLINQTDLNAEFLTGGIKHTLLVGAEFARQVTDNLRRTGYFGTSTTLPTMISVPISASNVRRQLTFAPGTTDANNHSVAKNAAGYVQDQIEITPQLEAIVGIRYDHLKVEFRNNRNEETLDVTDTVWSPRAGLIFKPVENASVYASYGRSFLPRSGEQLASLTASNASLVPEKFTNYEVGVKWDVSPDLNLTAALYQLDRDNVIVLIDPNNAASGTELGGGQRTKGVELSATGQVTSALQVIASYAYQDGKFTKAISATVQAGAVLANMPKHSASLWTRYDVTPDFGAGVGVTYQSKRYAAQDNLVAIPGYTRVDAALFYDISENLTLQANIENLFNERYYLNAHSNNNITPGSPTAFKAALTARF